MKKQWWICISLFFFLSCATPGQKFIDISYKAEHEKTKTGVIGLAPFKDKRMERNGGYIGYRLLIDNSQETYFVQGMNLADSLKKTVGDYYEKNGFSISSIPGFELSSTGVMNSGSEFHQIVTGQINKFECRAKKMGVTTHMTLEIDLILYTGKKSASNEFKTIPVTLTLERTEMTFTPEKLETFVNQSVEEVIQKALKL